MHSQLPPQVLKDSFFEYNKSHRIANSKVGCMLVVVLMPAGLTLDYFVYPQKLGLFFLLRIICSLLALVLWGLLSTSLGQRHFRVLGMFWFILPSLFISMMIYFSDGVHSSYYAGLNLVLIAISWVAQVDFLETVVASLLTLAMYCVACFAYGPVMPSILFNNLYFIVLTGIIVVTGSYYVNRLRFREYALRSEVDSNRKELEASNLKLIEMDRAKSEFFANISHELRTPLTLLIGPLEKLRTAPVPPSSEQQHELLDIMYGNSMRLLRLINDLLSLVRMDSGALVLRKSKIALKPFIEGIASSVTPMAQQSHLKFETNIAIESDRSGYIDRDKFEKIIFNLLFNAFKFTRRGGEVLLSVTMVDNELKLAVRDTGVGISPTDLERVFDRFWQAEGSTTRRYQGVGIGLALVKELARIHGGDVSAESELGRGTTMKVHLDVSAPSEAESDIPTMPAPVTDAPPAAEEDDWVSRLYRRAELFPAHVLGGAENASSEAKDHSGRPNVLVVDDEPDMRRFLCSQLQEQYQVYEARSGSQALELAQDKDFSLVLLDFMMPEMDGIEVMQRLKQCSGTRNTPVIILTARADEEFKIKTLKAGATDFLTKPFSSTELMIRAHNMIAARQLQQQVEAKTRQLEEALEQIKETEAQLVHQAKMASLGQLSAGLMHEINNPLNFANTAFHILKKRIASIDHNGNEALSKPLTDIQEGIQRVVAITSSLRSFTHPDDSTFSRVDLLEIVTTALRFVQVSAQEMSIEINIGPAVHFLGNSNQLVHLFINLLQNSIDSVRQKNGALKQIRVDASIEGDEIRVICYDNGEGISAEHLDRIFDAFFTTKKVGEGVGLGLNICHRIVEQHHGKIKVESQKGEYCRFIIVFPKYKP